MWWGWAQSVVVVQLVSHDWLQPHGLQHTRLPCPPLFPRVCSNSCPLSQWCHPAISSSVAPFSSCPQSLPASGSFSMSQFFASGGQTIGASASASVLPMNIQGCFRMDWLDLLALQGTLKSLFQHHNSKVSVCRRFNNRSKQDYSQLFLGHFIRSVSENMFKRSMLPSVSYLTRLTCLWMLLAFQNSASLNEVRKGWVPSTHRARCHPHCQFTAWDSSRPVSKLHSRTHLELFSCSSMLDDLGETVQEATCVICHTSQAHLAGGSSGHCSHHHSFSNLVSEMAHCLLGIAKDTLTFSKPTEGGDRKSAWVWTGLGSTMSVFWCVWSGCFQASQSVLICERGSVRPPLLASEDSISYPKHLPDCPARIPANILAVLLPILSILRCTLSFLHF